MSVSVLDASGATVTLVRAPRRVVSLVPSETETVALVAAELLVGRTDYCVEPHEIVNAVATLGGTKDARVADIIALRPDLVLANMEENTPAIVEALRREGVTVHVSFPKSVSEAQSHVRELLSLLGVDASQSPVIQAMDRALEEAQRLRAERAPVRVFCPIWMDPLMTVHGETFISDVLDLAGAFNVFNDRPRRYPLAADLGLGTALSAERVRGRDTRYPRVTLDEVIARAPELVLLPDEPHPFSEADAAVFRALPIAPRVMHVRGRDLCWYSPRMGEGVLRIAEQLRGG